MSHDERVQIIIKNTSEMSKLMDCIDIIWKYYTPGLDLKCINNTERSFKNDPCHILCLETNSVQHMHTEHGV